MMVSAVKVGLRKKEKANRPSGLPKILLGCYINEHEIHLNRGENFEW